MSILAGSLTSAPVAVFSCIGISVEFKFVASRDKNLSRENVKIWHEIISTAVCVSLLPSLYQTYKNNFLCAFVTFIKFVIGVERKHDVGVLINRFFIGLNCNLSLQKKTY